jgi:HlyD family secretion protein
MKRIVIQTAVILLLVLGVVYGGFKVYEQLPRAKEEIATTTVRQGDFVVRAFTRGELRAVRSATISAPNLSGQTQITELAAPGSFAREKNLVAAYDDSDVRSRVIESEIELEKIQQNLAKARAELQLSANKDEVDLLEARYAVRRAELEMRRNELLSTIDARSNELNLEEAQRRLERLQSDVQSKREQAEAQIRVLQEQRRRALIELNRDKARVLEARSLSPISGLVAVKNNLGAGGRFGGEVPELRDGDEVSPGTPVVDVLDLSELEIIAKVGEVDRANLREGQAVRIRLDAIPGETFRGEIKGLSSTATSNVMSGDPAKKFDVFFTIDMPALLKAAGATPEQIREIEETSRQNRAKGPSRPGASSGGGRGAGMGMGAGMAGGGMAGGGFGGAQGAGAPSGQAATGGRTRNAGQSSATGQSGAPGGAPGGTRGQGRAPGAASGVTASGAPGGAAGGAAGAMGSMSAEDRQRIQQAMQQALGGRNMQDLSADERREIFTRMRSQMPAGMGAGRRGGGNDQSDASLEAGPTQNAAGFTVADLAAAVLPAPPSRDSGINVLLRPGLLADVEIIVDEVKDALTIPMQAVFERDGKPVAFVKTPTGFEPRELVPARRTESAMVVAEGIRPGEVIALSDPFEVRRREPEAQPKGGPAALPGGAR